MKIISLHQPWASLVVMGVKKWETRSWRPSKLLGETIGIHATQSRQYLNCCMLWPFSKHIDGNPLLLPRGAILGTVTLKMAVTTEFWCLKYQDGNDEELALGNYSNNRTAWKLEDPHKFEKPIAARGYQQFWNYDLTRVDNLRKSAYKLIYE